MIEKKLNGTIVKLKTKYIKQYTINNIKQMNQEKD